MDRDKTNILDVLATLLLIIVCTGISASLFRNDWCGGLLFSVFALFLIWTFIVQVRKGVRPPTRWEWFKAWMTVRPIVIGAIGAAVLLGILVYGRDIIGKPSDVVEIVLTGGALIWAFVIMYTVWRAPHRHEANATYKKRIGWQGPDE